MKVRRKIVWLILSCLMVSALVLASCGGEEEKEEEEVVIPPGEEEVVVPPAEEEEVVVTPGEGNWWDKFGEPQYGGTITISGGVPTTFDPANWLTSGTTGFFDQLFIWDWTVDREKEWPFKTYVVPEKYIRGMLVETWEWNDPQTLILHIRKDISWQNKPPANGRKFTAYDIEHHYDRAMGTGSGYTEPNPLLGMWLAALQKATATDDYTVEMKFKRPTPVSNWMAISAAGSQNEIENPEAVKQYGPVISDWKYAVGTGPFILTDYVAESSMTLSRNPDYWGYDERHPENQLPYVDELRILVIPDIATARAALRTGKIDIMTGIGWEQAMNFSETSPELVQAAMPVNGYGVELRCDKEPFTDIRVRKALQMAIDRETIAETYYGGSLDGKPCGFVSPFNKGYAFAYDEWPQELKDEYSYNPERAKQLLAEAGYPQGFKTNVVVGTADTDLLQIIQSYFKDINVDMEIKTMEATVFNSYTLAGKHDQMVFRNWVGMLAPPDIGIMHLESVDPQNLNKVSDAGYDALVAEFRTVTDEAEAQRVVREADRYYLEHHWTVNLFPLVNYNIWQPYLKGYSGELIFVFQQYWYWARLWIDQDLKKAMGY
jgi:peptide/nickel transport system substrate-binding protein